ncbi:MAG TPA: HlyD family efflux transporter periplasmic adaptor subunit [Terriglobales bacterium]|nr:HlyD family efflux transporter periplasmic adaptor subunit [Terriglobales bacterium]
MSSQSRIDDSTVPAETAAANKRHRMSRRQRLLFFLTAWLIVLMPFLFWWNTWFGRQLSDKQISEYLRDEKHPRHIQHALVQIGDRMARHDTSAARWYEQLPRLSSHPVEEVRNTDAWVMGQDNSVAGLHDALLKMLNDPSLTVRGNAALSLVRFGDPSGRSQIVALLQPARVAAPESGKIVDAGKVGAAIHQGGLVAKLESAGESRELRSPIGGRIRSLSVKTGENLTAGAEVATIDPDTEQVWEALRALYLIGQLEDLPAIQPYERSLPDIPERVKQQAVLAEKAIRERAK